MKVMLIFLSILLLSGLISSAPTSKKKSEKIFFTKHEFEDAFLAYSGEHEIINVNFPMNSLNHNKKGFQVPVLFFVEADINNIDIDYKGLYVLNNGTATKILDNGRDITAGYNNNKDVYFGAGDGIYTYNAEEVSAEKYGSVTDNIIGIAKQAVGEAIYILTEDKHVYIVTDQGNIKTRINEIKNAQQIAMDFKNNLYYYDNKNHLYVYNGYEVKKIRGLPENANYIKLIRPSPAIKNRIGAIIDNKTYIIHSNGKAEVSDIHFGFKPSAIDFSENSVQYIAYDKKLYAFNLIVMILKKIFSNDKGLGNDSYYSVSL